MRMRSRLLLAAILVAVVLAAVREVSSLQVVLALVPIAILEPGSLLLLGVTFLTLAGLAQRALS